MSIDTELQDYYLSDLFEFAKYINPHYMYGEIHEEIFRELQYSTEDNILVLEPRGHLKSHCIAVWCVWTITKEPWTSIVYLSASKDLASVQMYSIKNMLTCQEYKDLWPDMINTNEKDRDKWTENTINVDSPLRREMGIRDFTLIIKTVKSSATGLHCDYLVADDIVTPKNAYTNLGRNEVELTVADFVSVKNTDARTLAVGTRYHPKDIYGQWIDGTVPVYNDKGEIIKERMLFKVVEHKVENRGDGTGQYLWPRTKCPTTGRWFGFDINELAKKKAEMIAAGGNMAHFWAQYYNDPSEPDNFRTDNENFQYYDKKFLENLDGSWYYKGSKLRLGVGMDLAFSEAVGTSSKVDYTAIVVIGIASDGFIYILDMDQFRTDRFSVYYSHLIDLHNEWGFNKVYLDTSGSGKVVKRELESKIRQDGYHLSVRKAGPYSSHSGSKEERFAAVVEPRYDSGSIFHYKGGLTPLLEEQIVKPRPANDDLEDGLFIALDNTKVPSSSSIGSSISKFENVVVANDRFGGRRRSK